MLQIIALKYRNTASTENDSLTGIKKDRKRAIRKVYKKQFNGIKITQTKNKQGTAYREIIDLRFKQNTGETGDLEANKLYGR